MRLSAGHRVRDLRPSHHVCRPWKFPVPTANNVCPPVLLHHTACRSEHLFAAVHSIDRSLADAMVHMPSPLLLFTRVRMSAQVRVWIVTESAQRGTAAALSLVQLPIRRGGGAGRGHSASQ